MCHIGNKLILCPLRLPLFVHQAPDIFHHLIKVHRHLSKLVITNHFHRCIQIAFRYVLNGGRYLPYVTQSLFQQCQKCDGKHGDPQDHIYEYHQRINFRHLKKK